MISELFVVHRQWNGCVRCQQLGSFPSFPFSFPSISTQKFSIFKPNNFPNPPPSTANHIHSIVGAVNFQGIARTDSSRLDHVADGESLDRLVLGDAASAVGAAHGIDVAAAVLVAAAVQKSVI